MYWDIMFFHSSSHSSLISSFDRFLFHHLHVRWIDGIFRPSSCCCHHRLCDSLPLHWSGFYGHRCHLTGQTNHISHLNFILSFILISSYFSSHFHHIFFVSLLVFFGGWGAVCWDWLLCWSRIERMDHLCIINQSPISFSLFLFPFFPDLPLSMSWFQSQQHTNIPS